MNAIAVIDMWIARLEGDSVPHDLRSLRAARDSLAGLSSEVSQHLKDCDLSGVTRFSQGKGFDECIESLRDAFMRTGWKQ